jgi:glycosyltransferase involved in cell wall biosynthesis
MRTDVPVRPDVSVIIPTFNRLWCLPEAVASCRQNRCRTEIIVVDDGSTDGTWKWLQTQEDVVSVRQPNWGKDWAVNEGFALSRGQFVRFLDSDDMLPPNVNDLQLEIAARDNADVVVGGYFVVDERDGKSTTTSIDWFDCDDFVAQQLGECDSSHYSAYLFRREFISDIPHRPEFGVRDDRIFVIEVALKHPTVGVSRVPCLIHRHHDRDRLQFQSGTRNVVTNWSHLELYKKIATILTERGEFDWRRRRAMARAVWPVARWIAYTFPIEGCEVANWVYELDPEFRPPETALLGMLYRELGFRHTENILRVRRVFKRLGKPTVLFRGKAAADALEKRPHNERSAVSRAIGPGNAR